MSTTRPIIDAVVEHLQAAIPWVSVEAAVRIPIYPSRRGNLGRLRRQ